VRQRAAQHRPAHACMHARTHALTHARQKRAWKTAGVSRSSPKAPAAAKFRNSFSVHRALTVPFLAGELPVRPEVDTPPPSFSGDRMLLVLTCPAAAVLKGRPDIQENTLCRHKIRSLRASWDLVGASPGSGRRGALSVYLPRRYSCARILRDRGRVLTPERRWAR
jgi:hypothetical protein